MQTNADTTMAKLISADLMNNKLCILEYTTNDGQRLWIKPDAFDADIVSHTYIDIGRIIFKKPITKISDNVFNKCYNLKGITIPNSVTTIGNNAFGKCKSLSHLTIGKNVAKIGYNGFKGCSNVNMIICRATTPPKLSYNSWDITPSCIERFETLVAPTGCEEVYANSDWGKYLK